jgi:hypothetical protein
MNGGLCPRSGPLARQLLHGAGRMGATMIQHCCGGLRPETSRSSAVGGPL